MAIDIVAQYVYRYLTGLLVHVWVFLLQPHQSIPQVLPHRCTRRNVGRDRAQGRPYAKGYVLVQLLESELLTCMKYMYFI